MTKQAILEKLREIHQDLNDVDSELKSTEKIDEETIQALGQLVADVIHVVDRAQQSDSPADSKKPTEPDAASANELLDRIQSFESHHPRVARLLSQVTDALANLGI